MTAFRKDVYDTVAIASRVIREAAVRDPLAFVSGDWGLG